MTTVVRDLSDEPAMTPNDDENNRVSPRSNELDGGTVTIATTEKRSGGDPHGGGVRDANLPPPPDGGWGWAVVFGSFMVHVIADGIAYSFGIYVEEFADYFECGRSEIGTLGSLMLGITWGSGPIASVLVNKYGCRLVTVLGTIVAAAGFLISLMAPNIWFMYFSFGIVAGVGLGMAYLPAIVAVSFYFEKRRSLATGIAVCGSGVGTFLFAPLTRMLLDEYSWKGTVLIETGLLLNCIICGMVFRPLNFTPSVDDKQNPDMAHKTIDNSTEAPTNSKTADDNGEKAMLFSSCTILPGEKKTFEECRRRHQSEPVPAGDRTKSAPVPPPELKLTTRKDVFYTKSLENFPIYKSDPKKYYESVTSVPNHDSSDDDDENPSCLEKIGLSKEAVRTLKELMDVRLLLDFVFVLFAISNLLTSIGFVVPYIFLYDRGLQKDLLSSEAAWLISVVGISNTIGRVLFGYIADFQCVNRLMLYNTVLVLCGLVSIFSFVCINFVMLVIYSFLFGLLIGVYTCLTPIVLVDLLGLDKLSNAFGIVLLFQGIGAVAGPPVAGAIFDSTQNYDYSFVMMGVCLLVSGLMLYPIPCIQKMRAARKGSEAKGLLSKSPTLTSVPKEQTVEFHQVNV